MESKQTTIWYMVRWGQITEVEVIQELPKSIIIKCEYGKDRQKMVRNNSWEKYFKTKKEAIDSIIEELKNDVLKAERNLNSAQLKLDKFLNSVK